MYGKLREYVREVAREVSVGSELDFDNLGAQFNHQLEFSEYQLTGTSVF